MPARAAHTALSCLLSALTLCLTAQPLHAITFTKVLDDQTSYAGIGSFASFDELAFDGTNVALIGQASVIGDAVFQWDGSTLGAVASTTTQAPDLGAATFTSFSEIDISTGNLAFFAQSSNGTSNYDGAYTTQGGSLRRVRDTLDTMPGSTVPFRTFSNSRFTLAIDGNDVAFTASGNNGVTFNEGVYLQPSNNPPLRMADRSTAIPDFTDDFIFFGEVDLYNGFVVFDGGRGSGGGNGFYTNSGTAPGTLRTVLNKDTVLPGLTNPISIFSPNTVRIHGQDIAFEAAGSDFFTEAMFIDTNGAISVAADETDMDPVSGNNFQQFYSPYSLHNGQLAFQGNGVSGPGGIYLSDANGIINVISDNSALDGKQLQDARLFKNSLHDGKLAFKAIFTDGSEGIYIADLSASPPVGQTTTENFAPLFDVEATPAFPGSFILNDGGFDIDVHQRASDNTDKRGLMEFNLASIPDDAVITEATLTVDVWLYSSDSVNGGPRVRVYGYTGDGTPGTSDPGLTSNLLAIDDETTGTGENDISLDPAFIQNLLLTDNFLGLVMLGSTNQNLLSFRTLESPFGADPVLSITYVVPLPGDLDGDGFVGISDLNLVLGNWNQTVPPGDPLADPSGDGFVGIEDLNDVLGNWNAGTPPTNDAVIPEPATLTLLAWGAASALGRRHPVAR